MNKLKSFIIITILVSIVQFSFGQDLKLSIYNMPARGIKDTGTSVGFLLPGCIGDIEVGGYYERNSYFDKASSDSTDFINDRTSTSSYSGVYSTIYLLGSEKFVGGVNMRAGMVDAKKVVITFAAIAEYNVNENLSIGASARFISKLPVLEAKISTTIGTFGNRAKRQQKYKEAKEYYRSMRVKRF
ncbi:hypothetical protein BFP72_14210 [Reichenbachiella sp. 5M10]|uniref:hypothetical protein n=1 Tax=Reichenbachiella sp. 5M10 TaxID=1889772 RepID=UPI000C14F4BA|nr:hypothetical protein [Reichenbachiella sp. 5M10]PIB36468.1 hypothetical protein BFP72_14210 [Reichenbachiella sp. 5M10]